MFRRLILALVLCLSGAVVQAQTLQDILQTHADEVLSPGRASVDVVLGDLVASGLPQSVGFLEAWRDREIVRRTSDGLFFRRQGDILVDLDTGSEAGAADTADLTEARPNGGVRRAIGDALVQFQLSDPDIVRRTAAVQAIARSLDATQLEPLAASVATEADAALKATKERLALMLTALHGATPETRIAAIETLSSEISVDVRGVLNRIVATTPGIAPVLPQGANVARVYRPGEDISLEDAYQRLVAAGLAQPRITPEALREPLIANIAEGAVGGVPVAQLDTQEARVRAYAALAAGGKAPPFVDDAARQAAIDAHVFFDLYAEPDPAISGAAQRALDAIGVRVAAFQTADLTLDALSLASIYFLAAIGLAITFGVMRVINMAHGEFIMMGAYTGYVIQLFVPDYTLSILIALPVAFALTFAAGVTMERLVIRHLYHRPLETLLATFGISIALQQLAKNIFGTQARPLTSPAWLDGALSFNDVVSISYIRIAIFVLALIFLVLILFVLKRTRLGLEVRAVTQNPGMAASMGINTDRINMLTFGLGSGIAGIAGVAIGLYAKVTSEMGADYIVQSFMTVVVGGVDNVWGTLAGASLIGFLQKGIEWFNPSNTLAAQTYMILFIILFIQFRPKGIVALKGRAAGD